MQHLQHPHTSNEREHTHSVQGAYVNGRDHTHDLEFLQVNEYKLSAIAKLDFLHGEQIPPTASMRGDETYARPRTLLRIKTLVNKCARQ